MKKTGVIDRVLEKFQSNPNEMLDVRLLCALLNIKWEDRQPIFVALHELSKSGEINRQPKKGQGSWYWYGDADNPPTPPAEAPRATPAASISRKTPAPARKPSTPHAPRTPKNEKPAPVPSVISQAAAPAADTETDPEVVFAITERGELGISQLDGEKKINVAIKPAAVRRLNTFLETTATLWGGSDEQRRADLG